MSIPLVSLQQEQVQFGLAGVGGSVSGTGNANFAGIVTATSLNARLLSGLLEQVAPVCYVYWTW